MLMKNSRLLILLTFVALASCNKDSDNFKSVGTITGVDGTMCGCCGGYIINIDNVRYLFDSIPKNSDLDLQQETFPLTVKLDWQLINSGCPPIRIEVLRIKKE